MGGNAPASAQHIAGDGEFVGGCANIAGGVVEDEVFQVNEFAIDPQRGAGIGELGALDPALADLRTGHPLVQTRESDAGVKSRLHQGCYADFREIIRH